MKFLYSDTQDYVDPRYDFLNDRSAPGRIRYWDDVYAHELLDTPPYDGLLIAMSAVRQADGVASSKVRYSTAEEQRMLRVGARKFLRLDGEGRDQLMMMGDCGAFAYVEHPEPAYSPEEVVDFYLDGEFTHGVSPDHVIFECDLSNPPAKALPEAHRRYQITLENAKKFIELVHREGDLFEPLGAVQGWSPNSMASAAANLIKMGYRYLAIGGLVPLKVDAIKIVLEAVRKEIGPEPKLHLLGFAKADHIQEFVDPRYGITSFDSTSPLIRAFKDEKANYYLEKPGGGIAYYTAIRIPQATENSRLMQGTKRGIFSAEDLVRREQTALKVLREFDQGRGSETGALEAIMDYHQFLTLGNDEDSSVRTKELTKTSERIERTLRDKPWKQCGCAVCRDVGVEVIIFRASNRNKRRGFHNLSVYYNHLKNTMEKRA